jgi:N-glycosidase YbiA
MNKIDLFEGSNAFLSNFFPCEILFEGETYPTSEHAFQAAKTTDPEERKKVREKKTPAQAKAAGKRVTLRRNWGFTRTAWMKTVLEIKFQNPELREKLRQTGTAELVEGNTWNDRFWGVCHGQGENRLGRILMQIRATL